MLYSTLIQTHGIQVLIPDWVKGFNSIQKVLHKHKTKQVIVGFVSADFCMHSLGDNHYTKGPNSCSYRVEIAVESISDFGCH